MRGIRVFTENDKREIGESRGRIRGIEIGIRGLCFCTEGEREWILKCEQAFNEQIVKLKLEKAELIKSLRGAREETSNSFDVVKQAINEAARVKGAFIAENARLQDQLSDKENALQSLRQEYECLKVREAAAAESLIAFKCFLAAATTTSMDSTVK